MNSDNFDLELVPANSITQRPRFLYISAYYCTSLRLKILTLKKAGTKFFQGQFGKIPTNLPKALV